MLEKFLAWSSKAYKKPWPIVIIAILATVFFALGIPKLKFDNNIKNMLPSTNTDLAIHEYYEDENRFGASDMIFVGVGADDAYSAKTLNYLRTVEEALAQINRDLPGQNVARLLKLSDAEGAKVVEALRGVGINEDNYKDALVPLVASPGKLAESFGWDKAFADKVAKAASKVDGRKLYSAYESPIDKTESIVSADYLAYEDDSLVVKKLVDGDIGPDTGPELKKRVESWDIYKDALVSDDGKLATVLVSLNTHDIDIKSSLNRSITAMLKAKADPAFKTYLDGEPVIEEMISSLYGAGHLAPDAARRPGRRGHPFRLLPKYPGRRVPGRHNRDGRHLGLRLDGLHGHTRDRRGHGDADPSRGHRVRVRHPPDEPLPPGYAQPEAAHPRVEHEERRPRDHPLGRHGHGRIRLPGILGLRAGQEFRRLHRVGRPYRRHRRPVRASLPSSSPRAGPRPASRPRSPTTRPRPRAG